MTSEWRADPVTDGPDADAESVARTILLDQLTGRARSREELRARLAKKDVPEEIATRLLDRFEEVGLIDDAAFARLWVEGRRQSRGLATRALALELRHKGVDDEVAKGALAEVDPDDEEASARALVRRRLRTVARVDQMTATRRLVSMLARKGYSAGLAYAVVRDELALGSQEIGSQEIGSQEIGSQEIGSQEIGSQEIGSQEIGSQEIDTP